MTITIAVGSTNPVKLAAVQTILGRAFVGAVFVTAQVSSGVPEQPWGEEQTREGALQRARRALEAAKADIGVGLEGGLMETPVGLMTCAWCVMVDKRGKTGYGGGSHMLLPPLIAEILQAQGELGPAMDILVNEDNTKQRQGAVGILTNGLINRQTAYEHLVAMAAAPFVTGYYG